MICLSNYSDFEQYYSEQLVKNNNIVSRIRDQKIEIICNVCGRKFLKRLASIKGNGELICTGCRGAKTCMNVYGVCNPGARECQKEKNRRKWTKEEIESRKLKTRETLKKKYGVDTDSIMDIQEIKDKIKATVIEKYGVSNSFNIVSKDGIKKRDKTCIARYGSINGFTEETLSKIRKSRYINRFQFEGINFDSSWEVAFYAYNKNELKNNIKRSEKSFQYEIDGKSHLYFPDFEIDGKYFEIKGNQFFKDGHLYNPYNQVWDTEKEKCILDNGVILLREEDLNDAFTYMNSTYGEDWTTKFKIFSMSKDELLQLCKETPFPGTEKWPADHPIWDCHLYKKLSPKDAWNDETCLSKAIDNLFTMIRKYPSFMEKINKHQDDNLALCRDVLTRFTVAKIAPKVTALQESVFLKNVDKDEVKNGVYCPMAGFGGIIRASKQLCQDVEAYDINQDFCDYYGWTKRDVLSDVIITDKTVIACPPFGDKTEVWPGTPEENYYSFDKWCLLIKEHIKAPKYIFFGPETNSDKNRTALFRKKYGIKRYRELETQ